MGTGPEKLDLRTSHEIHTHGEKLRHILTVIEEANKLKPPQGRIITAQSLPRANAIAKKLVGLTGTIPNDVIDSAMTICGYAHKHGLNKHIDPDSLWNLAMRPKTD